jgi:hypothetical protein
MLLGSLVVFASTAELAFSGAKGFGKYTLGGKGGVVYVVTSLDDQPKNPQPGTLRYAIRQKKSRIVVFNVSGVIQLKAPLKISHGNITIAGQSSPGGIVIAGAPFIVSNTQQVILRYLRFRLGTFGYAEDAITVRDSEQVIIDHCSMSWSVDETATFYRNRNFTLQNSIISHSLNRSIHPKGAHGYGGIWGGANASFINNIIANHQSRTPRINGHRLNSPYPVEHEFVELINNIIVNWGSNNVYGTENGRFNLINNYYKPGKASKRKQFADIWFSPLIKENQAFVSGNVYKGDQQLTKNNWLGVSYREAEKSKRSQSTQDSPWLSAKRLTPTNGASTEQEYLLATDNFNQVTSQQSAGANRNANGVFLDTVDTLVYQQLIDAIDSKGNGIINHEHELIGSWPQYAKQFSDAKRVIDENLDGIDDNWLASKVEKQKITVAKLTVSQYHALLHEYLQHLTK